MKLDIYRQIFGKNTEISNFMKTRPMGAEVFRADRRTGGREVDSRFSQFCERACRGSGVPVRVMKAYGGVEANEYLHSFLASAVVGGEC